MGGVGYEEYTIAVERPRIRDIELVHTGAGSDMVIKVHAVKGEPVVGLDENTLFSINLKEIKRGDVLVSVDGFVSNSTRPVDLLNLIRGSGRTLGVKSDPKRRHLGFRRPVTTAGGVGGGAKPQRGAGGDDAETCRRESRRIISREAAVAIAAANDATQRLPTASCWPQVAAGTHRFSGWAPATIPDIIENAPPSQRV